MSAAAETLRGSGDVERPVGAQPDADLAVDRFEERGDFDALLTEQMLTISSVSSPSAAVLARASRRRRTSSSSGRRARSVIASIDATEQFRRGNALVRRRSLR